MDHDPDEKVNLCIVMTGGSFISPGLPLSLALEIIRQWVNDPDNANAILRIGEQCGPVYSACRYPLISGMYIRNIVNDDAALKLAAAQERIATEIERQAKAGNDWKGDE